MKISRFWNRRLWIFRKWQNSQCRFGHKWISNSSCRPKDNNSTGVFDLRTCGQVFVCVVVRSQVVCVIFYVFFMICVWLAPDSVWLDNEIMSPPKDITTHLNPHLIHTNTNTCTSVSLGTLKVSIRNKKNRKKVSVICLTCASLAPHSIMTSCLHQNTTQPTLIHT